MRDEDAKREVKGRREEKSSRKKQQSNQQGKAQGGPVK